MDKTDRYTPKKQPDIETTPFDYAEEAWFWFILAQEARNTDACISEGASLVTRPCEPDDILKVVERLYRNRRLLMDHVLVLRHYGKRQLPPDPCRIKEARASHVWKEALERIEPILLTKGIVRPKVMFSTPGSFWSHTAIIYEGGLSL